MQKKEIQKIQKILAGDPWKVRSSLEEYISLVQIDTNEIGSRTSKQSRSFHLWLDQVAEEMDKHGVTVQNVVARIQKAEIRPTGENLKEVLWRPYQIAATGKESTTQLDKREVDKIYEGLNKFIGENFEIHIPFPSDQVRQMEQLGGYKSRSGTQQNYPEYTSEPTI